MTNRSILVVGVVVAAFLLSWETSGAGLQQSRKRAVEFGALEVIGGGGSDQIRFCRAVKAGCEWSRLDADVRVEESVSPEQRREERVASALYLLGNDGWTIVTESTTPTYDLRWRARLQRVLE